MFGFEGTSHNNSKKSSFSTLFLCFPVVTKRVVHVTGRFLQFPINYRPILINGVMEASYPSSTTLLVMCVMPTILEQMNRRLKTDSIKKIICALAVVFSLFMVLGRTVSGVHWITDIVGSVLLSTGLFYLYKACVRLYLKEN